MNHQTHKKQLQKTCGFAFGCQGQANLNQFDWKSIMTYFISLFHWWSTSTVGLNFNWDRSEREAFILLLLQKKLTKIFNIFDYFIGYFVTILFTVLYYSKWIWDRSDREEGGHLNFHWAFNSCFTSTSSKFPRDGTAIWLPKYWSTSRMVIGMISPSKFSLDELGWKV